MSMSGTSLKSALTADIYSQLQAIFPVNAALLAAEKVLILAAQQNLATAIANATGPDVITEVKNATVNPGSMNNGAGPVGGTGTLA